MELGTSAITGAVRVGIQVLVARKRPVLEIYQQIRNQFGPEREIPIYFGENGERSRTDKVRNQDIFVELTLVNLGGDRAEDVTFVVSGDFRREEPLEELPVIFSRSLPQFTPGQVHLLMRIGQLDLLEYEYSMEQDTRVGRPIGTKTDVLDVTIDYNGPDTWINRLLRYPRRLRGKKQFSTRFIFDPAIYDGDLPAPEYV